MSRGVKLFEAFHRFEPRDVREFKRGFEIPDEAFLAGDAKYVLYRSDKTDPTTGMRPPGTIDYIHKHSAGVKVYLPEDTGKSARAVPKRIRETSELVRLGDCLGFAFDDGGGKVEARATDPLPDLYCTPDGKALLVVQSLKSILAIIWGGKLGVEGRGIVH